MEEYWDLSSKIEKDTVIRKTKKGKKIVPRVCIKLNEVTLITGADPDMKQVKATFLESYDNIKWKSFNYFLSAEGERVSNRDDAINYIRKHLSDVVRSLDKRGIVSVKYSDDKYVFHRKDEGED